MEPIEVDAGLIAWWVEELGAIGACQGTGVCRTVYSPEWVKANALFSRWAQEAGLEVSTDAVGNVWAKLAGSEPGKAFVSGSHNDTQLPGGRYDGALGALSALMALKILRARYGAPRRTVEAVCLCEEEGSRFPKAAFWGSRAITGQIAPDEPDTILDRDGRETMAAAMREIGLDPTAIPTARRDDIAGFIELHIEQGPVLEQADLPVAVVDAITGLRHYRITLTGEDNHAGAFPMDARRDPMAGFAEIVSGVLNTAHRMGRPTVTTVGRCEVVPNGTAIVPKSVTFSLDARHPDPEKRALLFERHEALMREVAARRELEIEWEIQLDKTSCASDPALVNTFLDAAKTQDIPAMVMTSGAGHDAQQMALIAPMVMLFVRSKDGRSHTPEEFSSVEDIVAGIRVLAAGLYKLAW